MFTPAEKEKWAGEVWDILNKSYAEIGGFQSASSVGELIADSHLWKLVTRDGKITAVTINKDRFGRKLIAIGTDGTAQGKKDFQLIGSEDVRLGRSWAELSGKAESAMKKLGAKPIPSRFAELLTGKKVLSYSDDGFHYTRFIAGVPKEKIIYGVIEVTPELKAAMQEQGIALHDLQAGFHM